MSDPYHEPYHPAAAIAAGKKIGADGFTLLMQDHREVLFYLSCYEKAEPEARAYIERKIRFALLAHMAMEEQVLYPAALAAGAEALGETSFDDHEHVRGVLNSMETADADDRLAMILDLRQAIEAHVAAEEGELFPLLLELGLDPMAVGAAMGIIRLQTFSSLTGKPLPN